MSLLFIEGFDFYQNLSATTGVAARWTINSTSGASLVSGRFGGQAFRHSGSTQRYIQRSIPATNTLAIGLAIKIEDASAVDANRPLITFINASGSQCGVGINSSRQLIASTAASALSSVRVVRSRSRTMSGTTSRSRCSSTTARARSSRTSTATRRSASPGPIPSSRPATTSRWCACSARRRPAPTPTS